MVNIPKSKAATKQARKTKAIAQTVYRAARAVLGIKRVEFELTEAEAAEIKRWLAAKKLDEKRGWL